MTSKRSLGGSGFEVAPIGYGCMGISHAHGYAMEFDDGVRTVREAVEAGYTYFDTATTYTGTTRSGKSSINEEVVGTALAPYREQVVVATKFGVTINADHSLTLDSSAAAIRATVEKSLRQLGFDHLDLVYQARIDPNTEPEAVAQTMAELIAEGKVLNWGISETGDEYLRRAHAVTPVVAIQNVINMSRREHEAMIPVTQELGIAFTVFTPLMKGFLSARTDPNRLFREGDDYRRMMTQFSARGVAQAAPLYALLDEYANAHDATWAQICLAWLLAKGPNLIPVAGTTNPDRMRENLAAADIVLTAAELADIDRRLAEMRPENFGKE
ncbi:aldo/keto reductase [Actinomyces succiniciruminis]|uniref:Auxin-induced protein PCNT115 n=1 Tax=Actinomyces succiniciruminis TaxID=1522002 RepID=A0A1L7RSY8_9ACTO|nr:aldo/keto reductase [Actinomyces succiniciruminis]CED92554.1 Auxin-induced protein PCNT115 [Actinomyces succiniciruminis]